ncbi:MAG: response regulator [Eubacterium sp.]|jgi:DNA-binding response OmpR family regulator|nr:response regulator [Eubacterium sp.]
MNQAESGNSKKRILAVDDTAITLSRISEILQKDYEVITANSGLRAIKYLQEEKPDLILLDIRMNPMDGIETLRDIRKMQDRSDIPVIMLTGAEDKKTVIESAKLGICDYILKPFVDEELLFRIQRVMESGEQVSTQDAEKWNSLNNY